MFQELTGTYKYLLMGITGPLFLYVAKYHLGKVKLERVGQRSSPTSVGDLWGGPRGIAGLLVCPFASVALHCSFAC